MDQTIKMLIDESGYDSRTCKVNKYLKGEVYTVPQDLSDILIRDGKAKLASDSKSGAPKNKMFNFWPFNKNR